VAGVVESYLKFNYALRPAKQVERKLLLEALLRLGVHGYEVPAYTYLGFGAPYYADFQVFHRYLYIDRLICVEGGDIPNRMKFNKPFASIDLRLGMLADVIPSLDRSLRYLAWLDYDVPLGREQLEDVQALASLLSPGSILVVTVDAHARVRFEPPFEDLTGDQIQVLRAQEIADEIGTYLDDPFTTADYDDASLPHAFASALLNAMHDEVSQRDGLDFFQLFNFRYRDGAQMLSVGGIIDRPERLNELSRTSFMEWPHLNQSTTPTQILVPPLTPLERLWLDRHVTAADPGEPPPFELDDDYLKHFATYGRYYPQYFEAII
jgi:hypothetical protein